MPALLPSSRKVIERAQNHSENCVRKHDRQRAFARHNARPEILEAQADSAPKGPVVRLPCVGAIRAAMT